VWALGKVRYMGGKSGKGRREKEKGGKEKWGQRIKKKRGEKSGKEKKRK